MPELAYGPTKPRLVKFVGSSRRDLQAFPDIPRRDSGLALFAVQLGRKPDDAKPLRGFGGAGVQEIVTGDSSGTYRVVYAVSLPAAVYVLHAFQKRSTTGIKTSQRDIELIRQRLAEAERDSREVMASQSKEQ